MDRAAEQAEAAGLTGILVTPGPDLLYFTGYEPIAITERITLLVLQASRGPWMIVPILERPDAEAAPGAGALAVSDWTDGSDPYAATAKLLDPDGRYAFSDSGWAMQLLATPAGAARIDVRVDDEHAADAPRDQGRGGARAARCRRRGRRRDVRADRGAPFAGRRESEVAADLDRLLREHGHSGVEFTVVGSGPNGANPHHEMSEQTIEDGDMVVLDFGGIKDGYGSDTTRTVHVGEPTDEEREVHEIVRRAQQTGFEAVRPGVECQEIDRAARKVITDAGYGEYFIHRTGHGIGLTTHEPPYMIEGDTNVLEPGMCFSIEPGVYLPGRFGVRIEDIVTVTAEGGQRFNNTPHELQIVA